MSIQFPQQFRCCLKSTLRDGNTHMNGYQTRLVQQLSARLIVQTLGWFLLPQEHLKNSSNNIVVVMSLLPLCLLKTLASPNLLMVCSAGSGSVWPGSCVLCVWLLLVIFSDGETVWPRAGLFTAQQDYFYLFIPFYFYIIIFWYSLNLLF